MLTKRIIACLDVRDGQVVKGVQFQELRHAGDPGELARRYNVEGIDEVVVLDITATLSSAKHTENAIHISGVWMVPVTDKIEVGISAGPSVFMLKQDVPDSLSVSEPGPSVQSVGSSRVSKTTGGFNAGLDVTYLLTQKVGAGLLARYTWGSAKLGDSADSLTVGGFQLGGGLRLRF